ncbi:MAG: hypothetical protein KC478_07820 [Bacteriovoracaceae bacterium]|nr:hypothetical protein [Bacteriovoracaceae bacterium]
MKQLICILGVFFLSSIQALEYQGQIDFEHRQFDSDADSSTHDSQTSTFINLNASKELQNVKFQLGLKARDAYVDHNRDYLNLDDTNISWQASEWSLSLGTHIFNWKIMEFFSPIDSINPKNLSTGKDVERLGLPSLVYKKEFESSELQVIYIIDSKSSEYPQAQDRQGLRLNLQTPKYVEDNAELSNGDELFQFILRYKKSFEDFEFDAHVAQKYDTSSPLIIVETPSTIPAALEDLTVRPYYFQLQQLGMSIQTSREDWTYKLEATSLNYENTEVDFFVPPLGGITKLTQKDHSKLALGAERSIFYDNNHTSTLYFEYLSILGTSTEDARSLGAFQRDVFFGLKHALNDFKGHEFSLLLTYDLQGHDESIFGLSHEFRLNSAWKLEYGLTFIDAPKPDPTDPLDFYYGLKPLRESDNMMVTLSRYF